MGRNNYDAVVVGGGHNGLAAAAYLQRAGLRTLVLERRPVVGGACVTEEVFPGYRVSTAAYVNSLLRPEIVEELDLERHGLELIERDPSSFHPLPDGRRLLIWSDPGRTRREIAQFSEKDAENYPAFERTLERLAELLEPLLLRPPPDPLSMRPSDWWAWLSLAWRLRRLGRDAYELVHLLTGSVADYLDRWFESEALKATLATDGLIGAFASPRTPGTGYVLLHHVLGEAFGRRGVWTYVRGGMGRISEAMAGSFQSAGGEIRTSAPVAAIRVERGEARGVELASGETIHADRVLSNLDPERTFGELVPRDALAPAFLRRVRSIRYRSASFKINLALGGPIPWTAAHGAEPEQRGTMHVCPSMDYADEAYLDAARGRCSRRPVLELTMPSVLDDSLAPAGKHVVSIFAQYAPYRLADGEWTQQHKETFFERCLRVLEGYAPGVRERIEHVHLLSPRDLEETFGLTGGNIFQGEMALAQLLFMRPLPELARYRTPIRGLYLCGASTHPGGGVTGACGHNAAHEVLRG